MRYQGFEANPWNGSEKVLKERSDKSTWMHVVSDNHNYVLDFVQNNHHARFCKSEKSVGGGWPTKQKESK